MSRTTPLHYALLDEINNQQRRTAYSVQAGLHAVDIMDVRIDYDDGYVSDPTYGGSQGTPRLDINVEAAFEDPAGGQIKKWVTLNTGSALTALFQSLL